MTLFYKISQMFHVFVHLKTLHSYLFINYQQATSAHRVCIRPSTQKVWALVAWPCVIRPNKPWWPSTQVIMKVAIFLKLNFHAGTQLFKHAVIRVSSRWARTTASLLGRRLLPFQSPLSASTESSRLASAPLFVEKKVISSFGSSNKRLLDDHAISVSQSTYPT